MNLIVSHEARQLRWIQRKNDFVDSFEESFSVATFQQVRIAKMTASFHTERISAPFGDKFHYSYAAEKYKITKVDITSAVRTETGQ